MTKAKGNMYSYITHTHNIIKGVCPHQCSYCYMNKLYNKNWLTPKAPYLDEKELKVNIGKGNIIFVGSSSDMWADNIPSEWIKDTLYYLKKFDNNYIFQSKNPVRFREFDGYFPEKCITGTTIETNRIYPCMGKTPPPEDRAIAMDGRYGFITIEPILDFDLDDFVAILRNANPDYINIGADSGNNYLPEPPKEKIVELISELEKFTIVNKKKNLRRLVA